MFIDEVRMKVVAGTGGKGRASFFPGIRTSPDGGNGGNGGAIYMRVNRNLSDLHALMQTPIVTAENGSSGGPNRQEGKDGEAVYIDVPLGTSVIFGDPAREVEIREDRPFILVRGGFGGRGNAAFRSSKNRSPRTAEAGREGQTKELKVILRLIADYGLIGLPNAGKSSLLNELTKATAKIGNYEFTTLEPNLGSLNGHIIADIPGLIEGASTGKGLGIKFLKHVQKVSLLLHCVSCENADPVSVYKIVRKELEDFNPEMTTKPEYILLTKIDVLPEKDVKKLVTKLKKVNPQVYPISIHDFDGLENLKKLIVK